MEGYNKKCVVLLTVFVTSFILIQCKDTNNTHASIKQTKRPKVVIGNGDEFTMNYDRSQEKVAEMGGIDIQNKTKRLAAKLRILANNQLGVLKMQVCYRLFTRLRLTVLSCEQGINHSC